MRQDFIITYLGEDKPGLVDRLSGELEQLGANWLTSRSVNLGGHFCGAVRVNIAVTDEDRLRKALTQIETDRLQIAVRAAGQANDGSGLRFHLSVVGNDRLGIVKQVTNSLAALAINIEELETEISAAPWSGEPTFKAEATLSCSQNIGIDDIQSALEKLPDDLMFDLNEISAE